MPTVEHKIQRLKEGYSEFLEKYKGSNADAAIEYITQLKNQGVITDDSVDELYNQIKDYKKVEQEKESYLKNQFYADDGILPTWLNAKLNDLSVGAKVAKQQYGDIPVADVVQTVKEYIKQGKSFDAAIGRTYFDVKKEYGDEVAEKAFKAMIDTKNALLKEEEPVKYKDTLYKDVITSAEKFDYDNLEKWHIYKGTPKEPGVLVDFDKFAGKGKTELYEEYDRAVEFMRSRPYIDAKQAIGDYVFETYGLKGLPKEKKKQYATAIAEAARYSIPKNMVDYSFPKINEVLYAYKDKDVMYGGYKYYKMIEPILDANGYTKEQKDIVAVKIKEAVNEFNEYKDNPKLWNILMGILDVPHTNAWLLDVKTERVDDITKRALAKTLMHLYEGTPYKLDEDSYDPYLKAWGRTLFWIGLGTLGGLAGREALLAGKMTKAQILKAVAYEVADSTVGGAITLGKGGAKIVKGAVDYRKFIRDLEQYDRTIQPIVNDAIDGLKLEIDDWQKRGMQPDMLKQYLKDFLIEKKVKGDVINPEDIQTMFSSDEMRKLIEQSKSFTINSQLNTERLLGKQIKDIVNTNISLNQKLLDAVEGNISVGREFVIPMMRQPEETMQTIRAMLGDDVAEELVTNMLPQSRGYKYLSDLTESLSGDTGEEIMRIGSAKTSKKWSKAGVVGQEEMLKKIYRAEDLKEYKLRKISTKGTKLIDSIEQQLAEYRDELAVAGDTRSAKAAADYFFKSIKTNLSEKFGLTGEFYAYTMERIWNESGNIAAAQITKSKLEVQKFVDSITENMKLMKGDYYETPYGTITKKEGEMLLMRNLRKKYEMLMQKSVEEQVLRELGEPVTDISEAMQKILHNINDIMFRETGERAEKAGFHVIQRQLQRELEVVKADTGWKIRKKNGYTFSGLYKSKDEATKAMKDMYTKQFVRKEYYRPLYVDFEKVRENLEDVAEKILDLQNKAGSAETLYDVMKEKIKFGNDAKAVSLFDYIIKEKEKRIEEIRKSMKGIRGEEKYHKMIKNIEDWIDAFKKADGEEQVRMAVNFLRSETTAQSELYKRYVQGLATYFNNYEKKLFQRKYGHVQYERIAWLPKEYYVKKNLFNADLDYLYRANRRIHEIQLLGENDEVLTAMYEAIRGTLGEAAGAEFWRYKEVVFGRYAYNRVTSNVVAAAATYQVLTKMTLSALAQFQQLSYSAARGDMKSFFKAIGTLFSKSKRAELDELISHIDTSIVNIRSFQKREELGLSMIAERALRLQGMVQADMFSRRVAAITGNIYAKELVKKFKANPEKYAKRLIELNINPLDVVKNGFELTNDDLLKAMQKFEIDTNFRHNILDLPEFVTSTTGKFLFALQSTVIRQTKFVKKFIIDELVKGNPLPLLRLSSVGFVTAMPKQFVRQYLNGEEVDINVLNALIDVGVMYGYFGTVLESTRMGLIPLGANVGTLYNAFKTANLMLNGDFDRALFTAMGEIPLAKKIIYRDKYIERGKRKKGSDITIPKLKETIENYDMRAY